MLTYDIENRGKTPAYIFLYENIKNDIERGFIKPGEKLPSKRSFATHLRLSVTTIQNAYYQLISEGYIYSRPNSGYYAAAIEPVSRPKTKKFAAKETPAENKTEYFADFCDNNINTALFPFSLWSKSMREVLSESGEKALRKIPNTGAAELRKSISDHLYRFRGMNVEPERIIIGAGAEYLYGLLVKLLGKDKIYALEDPGYGKIGKIYNIEDVKVRYIPLDKSGVSCLELEKQGADIVHISPSHHFPTGIVTPIKRRWELLGWALEKEGRYIIEDDYDSEFRFTGRPLPTVESIDKHGRVIYINTFSKTISPSLRISYMALPEKLFEKYQAELGFYSCAVSSIEQYTLAKFISKGYFERHINRMRKFYKTLRDSIIKSISESLLSDMAVILEEDAGLHFILKLDTKESEREIIRRVREKGVNITCLSEYCQTPYKGENPMLVINYSGVQGGEAEIKKAIEVLSSAVMPGNKTLKS